MEQIDAIVGQYNKTILDLSARLAQAAAELLQEQQKNEAIQKQLASVNKELDSLKIAT